MEVNFRGLWLCARLELKYMVAQDVGETHDGRSGFKGSIVNVASNIHQFSEPYAREGAPLLCFFYWWYKEEFVTD